jgi:hypothetical protein
LFKGVLQVKKHLAAIALCFSLGAFAQAPQVAPAMDSNAALCQNHAYFVYQVTGARDRGLSRDEVVMRIKAVAAAAVPAIDTDNLAGMLGIVKVVYDHPEMDVDALVNDFLDACLGRIHT